MGPKQLVGALAITAAVALGSSSARRGSRDRSDTENPPSRPLPV